MPIAMRKGESANLVALRAFARDISRGSWFAACGEPLTDGERAEASAYVTALLGRSTAPIEGVADWMSAAAIIKRDYDHAWWDAEMRAQQEAQRRGEAAFGKEKLFSALNAVIEAAAALHGPAALAASRAGITDQALIRAAAGAAAQACHQAALAVSANGGPRHPFTIKYRLFAGGRWPLGFDGNRFVVF